MLAKSWIIVEKYNYVKLIEVGEMDIKPEVYSWYKSRSAAFELSESFFNMLTTIFSCLNLTV